MKEQRNGQTDRGQGERMFVSTQHQFLLCHLEAHRAEQAAMRVESALEREGVDNIKK